jgi:ATP-dependent Clp protease ATP-binding subunit ClpC
MNYTKELEELFRTANGVAETCLQQDITCDIFLLGMVLADSTSEGKKILDGLNASASLLIREELLRKYNASENEIGLVGQAHQLDRHMSRIMNLMVEEIKTGIFKTVRDISSVHILYIILKDNTNPGYDLLKNHGFTAEQIRSKLFPKTESKSDSKSTENKKETILDVLGRNLTQKARDGKIDPVIGRHDEIKRVEEIIGRYKKNNPILIGEAGVGKTAVVEGFAQRIVNKEVPLAMQDKIIYELDLNAVVAGTKYRGQFEERMKTIIKEATANKNIILFIDEFHTLVSAGAAEGALDASNILKPYLARGEMQVIGATTLSEFRKYIEKDSALSRRVQQVMVDEPSKEDCYEILDKLKYQYEKFHNVTYDSLAVKACVDLSIRYVTSRYLPDKAIDLIDEAGSMVKINGKPTPPHIRELNEEIEGLQAGIKLMEEKEDYGGCAKLKKERDSKSEELKQEIEKFKEESKKTLVTIQNVKEVVARSTGIPVDKMNSDDFEKILKMEENLKKKVIGQDRAINKLTTTLKRNMAGLRNPNRPIGSFVFMGPSGVGKTYMVKKLAEEMFGSEDALIKFDMSEFSSKYEISKLIGAAPGYVGYDEGGQLTEAVRRKPFSLLLFDEIEKAHPEIFNIFLQILDEGKLTDAFGRKVNFKNTVIVFTSNIGTSFEKRSIGYIEVEKDINKDIFKAFNKLFSRELINRLDDKIIFNVLEKEHFVKILDLALEELQSRIEHIKLNINNEVKEFIIEKSSSEIYGARNLHRTIQDYLETGIADMVLNQKIKDNTINIILKDEKIQFE